MISNLLHQSVVYTRKYLNRLVHIPLPTLVTGADHIEDIAELVERHHKQRVFVVTDSQLMRLGLLDQLMSALADHKIDVTLYDEVTPDPTEDVVEKGRQLFQQGDCDSIIAFGGGSVMDCAKAIGACVVKNKPVAKLAGLFSVRTELPYFIAVPTTAGTGSEATLVAVITNKQQKQKFTVIDPCLVPKVAILDPKLMTGLPAKITAETGIDALTHAIESYIGQHANPLTKQYALSAMTRIFKYLPLAYQDGDNIEARAEMALASFYAGAAFTRTSVGYVHAIAHQLGGYYQVPHGLANAIVLPHVLTFSFDRARPRLAQIAKALHLVEFSQDDDTAAQVFVDQVKALLVQLNITTTIQELNANDIPVLAKRAISEAFCDYPVPKLMTQGECEEILQRLLAN